MSALASVLGWVALAGWIAAGVLLLWSHRRLASLERAHSARKWDIIALRAEIGALQRRLRDAGVPGRSVPGRCGPEGPGPERSGPDCSGPIRDGVPQPRHEQAAPDRMSEPGDRTVPPDRLSEPVNRPVAPTGPTAWRRAHRRPASPRRRRPS